MDGDIQQGDDGYRRDARVSSITSTCGLCAVTTVGVINLCDGMMVRSCSISFA